MSACPTWTGARPSSLRRKGGFKAPDHHADRPGSDSDTILGLDAGANDYVTKPFRFAVLLARIRAQLRQHEQSEDAIFTIGPYTFRPAQAADHREGRQVRLTEKETAILNYLYRAGQKVVTRDVLLSEVWGYNAGVTTHTLETHVYRLRQKIERDPSNAEILVTEHGGYNWCPRAGWLIERGITVLQCPFRTQPLFGPIYRARCGLSRGRCGCPRPGIAAERTRIQFHRAEWLDAATS